MILSSPIRGKGERGQWRQQQAGFTLIELIVIIMIIGLLALFTMPRFDYGGTQVVVVSKKLVEDLRYAQNRAVTTQIGHGLFFPNCAGGNNCVEYIVSERNPADLNNDGVVNILDTSIVTSCIGQNPATNFQCRATDTDGDGDVDAADLGFVTARFGQPGVPTKDPLTGEDMVVAMNGEYDGVTLSTTLPNQTMLFEPSGSPNGLVLGSNTIDVEAGESCERISITVTTGLVSQGSC